MSQSYSMNTTPDEIDTLDIPFEYHTDVDSASIASSMSSARAMELEDELSKLECELSLVVQERDRLRNSFVETELRHRKSIAVLRARVESEQPHAMQALEPALAELARAAQAEALLENESHGRPAGKTKAAQKTTDKNEDESSSRKSKRGGLLGFLSVPLALLGLGIAFGVVVGDLGDGVFLSDLLASNGTSPNATGVISRRSTEEQRELKIGFRLY